MPKLSMPPAWMEGFIRLIGHHASLEVKPNSPKIKSALTLMLCPKGREIRNPKIKSALTLVLCPKGREIRNPQIKAALLLVPCPKGMEIRNPKIKSALTLAQSPRRGKAQFSCWGNIRAMLRVSIYWRMGKL